VEKRNILVTGGAGFIGSSIVNKLAENPIYNIVVVDNLLTGSRKRLNTASNITFIKADVNNYRDIASIFHRFTFDYVFHYAAVVGVERTLNNPIMVLDDLNGIKNILNLCKNTSVKRIFYSSSSEVYGEAIETPQNELTTPLNSRLPYAIVKNAAEAFIKSYHQEFGLNYTIFRFFNTYGPMQSKDFVISKFIAAALKNEDITIYGDGTQSRTFCFVNDNISACINAFEKELFINDVVNIGSSKEVSILELAEAVVEVANSNSKIKHLPPLKEGDMQRRFPDTRKMEKLLEREPIPLKEGLAKIISKADFILE